MTKMTNEKNTINNKKEEMNNSLRLLLLVSLSIFGFTGFAQQSSDTMKLKEMEKVVVTAFRDKVKTKYIAATVHSLDYSRVINTGSRTVPEALQQINGVFVQKTNHGGGSPFLRGTTGNQVLVLIDGIRLNNSTFRFGPNQYLNTIDAFSVGSIEVAKGKGSVQYGSDAIGGVIQVLTKEPAFVLGKPQWHGSGLGRYMTGDMDKTVRAEGNYAAEKFAFSTGVTIRKFGDIIGGDTTGKQTPSGYDEQAFDGKLKWKLAENTQLTAAHQSVFQHHVPVFHKVVLENYAVNEMDPQQRSLSYLKVNNVNSNSAIARSIEASLSYQYMAEGRNSRKNNSTILRKEKDIIRTLGASLDMNSVFTKVWTANTGVEFYHDNVNSTRSDIDITNNSSSAKRGLYPDDSRYSSLSVYSLHHLRTGKFRFEAGLRYNSFSIRIKDTTLGEVHLNPSAIVGEASVLYSIKTNHHLYISFNNSYRAPNIDDMGTLGIVDFRYEVPAYDLKPEKSLNYEAGYKYSGQKLSLSASFYYMDLSNIIARVKRDGQVINGYPVYEKENIEEAYVKGTEIEARWMPVGGFSFYGGISYTFGQNLTRKEPMRRIPPFNGRFSTTYKKNNWFITGEWVSAQKQTRLAQGDKDDNRIPVGGTPGWNVINLYGGITWKHLEIGVGLQNLMNEDYRTHGSGINGYGRSGWMNIKISF